ncbi:hypothetical protein DIPPA_27156 [Diplonema papillatum]|nr:hypothetical protein DIPPA_27156 [Diplonema papillatum]|eukprot:gene20007-30790_t
MAASRLQNEALDVLQDLKESFMQMYDDIEHYKQQTKQIDTKIAGCRRVLREVQMGDLGDVVMIDENGFGHLPRSGRGITINLANNPSSGKRGAPSTFLTASSVGAARIRQSDSDVGCWAAGRSGSSGRECHSDGGSVLVSPLRSAAPELLSPTTPAEEPLPVTPSSYPMQPYSPQPSGNPSAAVLSPNTAFEADVHATLHETEELLRIASDLSHANPRHTLPVGTDFTKLAREAEAEAEAGGAVEYTDEARDAGFAAGQMDESAEESALTRWREGAAPSPADDHMLVTRATLSPPDANLAGRQRLNTSMRSSHTVKSLMSTSTTLPSRFDVPSPDAAEDQEQDLEQEHGQEGQGGDGEDEEGDVHAATTTQSSFCPEFSAAFPQSRTNSYASLRKLPSSSFGTTPSTPTDPFEAMAQRFLATGLWKAKQDPRGHTYYYNTKDKSQRTWNLKKLLAKEANSVAADGA